MFTEAQIQYLQDVLGTSADSFRAKSSPEVVVLTPVLNEVERALLFKVLASIQLNGFVHLESDVEPEGLACLHLVRFTSEFPFGRSDHDQKVCWTLPALAQMVGTGPEVAARKKEAWAVLQQLAQERI